MFNSRVHPKYGIWSFWWVLFSLRGQCHEIGYLKAAVHQCKTGSQDSAGFVMTRLLFPQLRQFALWLGRLLAYRGRHSAICQGTLSNMPKPANFNGFYYNLASNLLAYCTATALICKQWPLSLHKLPTLANRLEVTAKSAGSEDPVLTLMGALLNGR
jgi:hypothetical protein